MLAPPCDLYSFYAVCALQRNGTLVNIKGSIGKMKKVVMCKKEGRYTIRLHNSSNGLNILTLELKQLTSVISKFIEQGKLTLEFNDFSSERNVKKGGIDISL